MTTGGGDGTGTGTGATTTGGFGTGAGGGACAGGGAGAGSGAGAAQIRLLMPGLYSVGSSAANAFSVQGCAAVNRVLLISISAPTVPTVP